MCKLSVKQKGSVSSSLQRVGRWKGVKTEKDGFKT